MADETSYFFSRKAHKRLLKKIRSDSIIPYLKTSFVDKRIKQSMVYFVKTGGKRIRPFLITTWDRSLVSNLRF